MGLGEVGIGDVIRATGASVVALATIAEVVGIESEVAIGVAVGEGTGAGVGSGANPGDRAETSERARTTTVASRLNMARFGAWGTSVTGKRTGHERMVTHGHGQPPEGGGV
jgi:hypothetical protein